jgi:hypothetical protein
VHLNKSPINDRFPTLLTFLIFQLHENYINLVNYCQDMYKSVLLCWI